MKTPLNVENAAMAIALFLAGIRPADEDGFAMIVYTEKFLKDQGLADIPEAMRKNVRGPLSFFFDPEQAEQYDYLRQIWDLEKEKIKEGLDTELSDGVTAEDVVRIVARTLHCRKQITQDWKKLPIFALIPNEGEIEESEDAEGVKTYHLPGYKMVNINASEKIKSKLGL